jgi:ribosomal protein S18 acetylase RimI-like enzyme
MEKIQDVEIMEIERTCENKKKVSDFIESIGEDFPEHISKVLNMPEYIEKVFKKAFLLGAFQEERIVGIIFFYANNFIEKTCQYSLLGVARDFRGRGIAETLINKSLLIAKDQGMETAFSRTNKDNEKSIFLQKKLGFEIDPSGKTYYEGDIGLIKKL